MYKKRWPNLSAFAISRNSSSKDENLLITVNFGRIKTQSQTDTLFDESRWCWEWICHDLSPLVKSEAQNMNKIRIIISLCQVYN